MPACSNPADAHHAARPRWLAITTTSAVAKPDFRRNRPLQAMVLVYGLVWLWSVINPVLQGSIVLENLMTVVALLALIGTYRLFVFSNVSYLAILVFLVLHAAGGHYTYAGVPLGRWLGDALGDQRNPYDRIVHFSFGLLCVYPLRELTLRLAGVTRPAASLAAVMLVLAASAVWEIFEWLLASNVDPQAAEAFLAIQGDPWDAQKDMMLAGLGACITVLCFVGLRRQSAIAS